MIFCARKSKKEKIGCHKQISLKSFNQFMSMKSFLVKLDFLTARDANKAYDIFFQELIEVVNNIVSLATVTQQK